MVALVSTLTGCAHMPVRSTVSEDSKRTALSLYMRGLMLERSSHLSDALSVYQEALEHNNDSSALAVRIGATHVKLGHPEQALRNFQRALALEPDDPDALRWIAMLQTSQGRIVEAVAAYRRLLEQQPADRFVLSTLADLYVMQGDLEQAVELYDRMVREFGPSHQLHFNLGILYGRLGRLSDSIQELSRALELSPDSVDIRVALALTYELNDQLEAAATHYEDAITLDPLNPRLYLHAARVRANQRRFTDAIHHYQVVLDLMPSNMEAILGLVRLWMMEKDFDQAQQLLGAKLKSLSQTTDLYLLLGLLYREANVPEEALRAFERATTVEETSPHAHFYLGGQLERLNRKPEARLAFRRTLELDPNYADTLNYLGYMDAEEGVNLPEAKAMIEHALSVDPDNGAYIDSLGWVYYQMGELDHAIEYLARATRLTDTDPAVFEHLGDAYFKRGDVKRGDMQKAQTAWEQALVLDASLDGIKQKLERIQVESAAAPALLPTP